MIIYYPDIWDQFNIKHLYRIKQVLLRPGKLIVGVCADSLCKAKIKQNDRAEILKSLKGVCDCTIYTTFNYQKQIEWVIQKERCTNQKNWFACGEEFGKTENEKLFLRWCSKNNIGVIATYDV